MQDPAIARRIRVIDFNPQVKQELDRRGIANVYGDVSHLDTLQHAKIGEARILLSTLPDSILKGTTNLRLLRQMQRIAPQAKVLVTADFFYLARQLYEEGAAFVFVPRLMSVRDLAGVVCSAMENSLDQMRSSAVGEISSREEVLP